MADNTATKANLSVSLDINTNSQSRPSCALLVYEALVSHRDTHLNLAFEDIQGGNYDNAFRYFEGYEDLNGVIDSLVHGIIILASDNYVAADAKGCSADSLAQHAQKHKMLRDADFRQWKAKYVGKLDPDGMEAEVVRETGLSVLNGLRGKVIAESDLRSIAAMYGVEDVPHIAEIIEGTDEPKAGTTLNDLIGMFTPDDFSPEKHDPTNPNQELAALCHDLKNKDDLKTLDILARQGYTLSQLSDVAYRIND